MKSLVVSAMALAMFSGVAFADIAAGSYDSASHVEFLFPLQDGATAPVKHVVLKKHVAVVNSGSTTSFGEKAIQEDGSYNSKN